MPRAAGLAPFRHGALNPAVSRKMRAFRVNSGKNDAAGCRPCALRHGALNPAVSRKMRAFRVNSAIRKARGGMRASRPTVQSESGQYFQNRTQEIQFILAGLNFGVTAKETEGKKLRVPIPLIYGDRDSFAQTPTGMCQRRLAAYCWGTTARNSISPSVSLMTVWLWPLGQ